MRLLTSQAHTHTQTNTSPSLSHSPSTVFCTGWILKHDANLGKKEFAKVDDGSSSELGMELWPEFEHLHHSCPLLLRGIAVVLAPPFLTHTSTWTLWTASGWVSPLAEPQCTPPEPV
ncbi:hypothetical protein Pcinc_037802 [Petrolisthes cinctipes]|uniref:Uncharacterized protein n=1 Tax=Petrolisthes cinctipes TaxID=88211 RepID=A0AAE1BV97_PETCI|nr:hypothetical protein Pcinc_037802 [Petrolisthes cinctipes]